MQQQLRAGLLRFCTDWVSIYRTDYANGYLTLFVLTRFYCILFPTGFTSRMMDRPSKDFSGGWRMRIALAKALFVRPQILLLDEPTNHLDLCACVWLEQELRKYTRILVLVSHSQVSRTRD